MRGPRYGLSLFLESRGSSSLILCLVSRTRGACLSRYIGPTASVTIAPDLLTFAGNMTGFLTVPTFKGEITGSGSDIR